jgi:tetratricopeptide (TPR) repeat protein
MVDGTGRYVLRIGGPVVLAVLFAILLFWQPPHASGLEAATAGSPQQAQAQSLAQQSRTQAAARQWDEAIATAERALAADAKSPAALIARGVARGGKGEFDAAIKDFDAVTGQAGRDPALIALRADAHVQRSKVQYAQGKYLPAIDSCYYAILEQNNSFDAHFNRGLAYLARHDYDKAIRSFDRAIQIDPKSAESISHRGFAHGALGRYDNVIWDQNKAIELDPKLAIAYERRAAARIAKGGKEVAKAAADVAKALELDPKLPEALCDRALLAAIGGDAGRAVADVEAAIAAAPKLARARLQRGLLWLQKKDAEQAIAALSEAIRLDPKSADAYAARGQANLANKAYEPAVADFSEAITLNAKLSGAYAGRAQARKKLAVADDEGLAAIRADLAKAKELDDVASGKKKPDDSSAQPPRFDVESAPVDPARHAAALASAKKIDGFIAANYAKHKITPMPPADDATFVRRIYLDIAGRIPTYQETTKFLASRESDKRTQLIDQLLGSDDYASHFFNYWADVLRYRDSPDPFVRGEPYRQWIKESLAKNTHWDEMVHAMLASDGQPWKNPATGYLQRDPGMPLDNVNNTIRIFLGTRIGCAQCHNHPFDKWTQKQFYQAAAYVYGTQTRTNANDKRFWSDKPGDRLKEEYAAIEQEEEDRRQRSYQFANQMRTLTNVVFDDVGRKIRLPKDYAYSDAKPGDVVEPKTLFGSDIKPQPGETPRQVFARWLTSKDNPRFAITISNRLWKQVFGAGQIEPVDDMMDSTVAENPELMKFLEAEMRRLNFDMKEYLRILFNTETYQRQACNDEVPLGAPYHLPGPVLRRMTAEQAWDSFVTLAVAAADYREPPAEIYKEAVAVDLSQASAPDILTSLKKVGEFDQLRNKTQEKFKYKGNLLARASELPSPLPPNHFLRAFGQSDRELISASSTMGSVPQVLFMFNGQITHMLLEKNSTIYNNIVKKKTISDGVKVVFLTILNREPDAEELATATAQVRNDGPAGYGNVVWSLVNTREFMFVQ